MKGSKHTPAQIIEKLQVAEIELANGAAMTQVTAKLGVTEKTDCRWRAQYGGMKAEEARRLKALEIENARLKRAGGISQNDGDAERTRLGGESQTRALII